MSALAWGDDGTLALLADRIAKPLATFAAAISVARTDDGMIVADMDGNVQRWQWREGALVLTKKVSDPAAAYSAVASFGADAWLCDRNGVLVHIDPVTLAARAKVAIAPAAIACACDSERVVYAFDDGRVHVHTRGESFGLFPLPSAPTDVFCFNAGRIALLHGRSFVSYDSLAPDEPAFRLVTPSFIGASMRGSERVLITTTGEVYEVSRSGGLQATTLALSADLTAAAFDGDGAYVLKGNEVGRLRFSDSGFDLPLSVSVKAHSLFTI